MNRNFIFVFILLAALSIVDAAPHKLLKRKTEFEACSYLGPDPPPLLTVEITPDSVVSGGSVTLNVSGTLDTDMPKEALVASFFADLEKKELLGDIGEVFICLDQKQECPKYKEPFNATITIPVPDELPNPYSIVTGLLVYTELWGCSAATFGDKKLLPKTLSSSSFFF